MAAVFLQAPAGIVLEIYNAIFSVIFRLLENIAGDAMYVKVEALDSDMNVIQTAASRDELDGSPSVVMSYPSSLGGAIQSLKDFFHVRIDGTAKFITVLVGYYAIELIIFIKLLKGYGDRGEKIPKITQRFE